MQRFCFSHVPTGLVLSGILLLVGWARAAEPEFPMVKPGPEHEVLKKLEGTWQATIKMNAVPGQPAIESKGTMTYKMECNGLWLCSNCTMEFGGQPFQGKGMESYDPAKKKYVLLWVDSMASTPMIGEGTYDKASKTLTTLADYPGHDGKVVKHKMVSVFKDDDTIEWSMSVPDKERKDAVMMTIHYKRKK